MLFTCAHIWKTCIEVWWHNQTLKCISQLTIVNVMLITSSVLLFVAIGNIPVHHGSLSTPSPMMTEHAPKSVQEFDENLSDLFCHRKGCRRSLLRTVTMNFYQFVDCSLIVSLNRAPISFTTWQGKSISCEQWEFVLRYYGEQLYILSINYIATFPKNYYFEFSEIQAELPI